jgi:hypothetical protein
MMATWYGWAPTRASEWVIESHISDEWGGGHAREIKIEIACHHNRSFCRDMLYFRAYLGQLIAPEFVFTAARCTL